MPHHAKAIRKGIRVVLTRTIYSSLVAGCLGALPALARADTSAVDVTLAVTGSTLMQPLLQEWEREYSKVQSDVKLTTAGTGSGAGIAAAIDGSAQIGASDAYMSDNDVVDHPDLLNVALGTSRQIVNYNLPELTAPLRLSGPVLAGIYAGTIRDWSAAEIAALNPGAALPHHAIAAIRGDNADGDTSMFTQYLTYSTPDLGTGPGAGTSIKWPDVPGLLTATGNAATVQLLGQTLMASLMLGRSAHYLSVFLCTRLTSGVRV